MGHAWAMIRNEPSVERSLMSAPIYASSLSRPSPIRLSAQQACLTIHLFLRLRHGTVVAATKLSSYLNIMDQEIFSASRNVQDDSERQRIGDREDVDVNGLPSDVVPSLPKSPLTSLVAIIVSLGAAAFLSALDATVVAVLTPTLADEFQSVDSVAWYGSI